jgi:predicted GTPase
VDVDIVADMTDSAVSEFLKCFDRDFYVSEAAIREAVRRKSCFHLIHLPTSFKVDVFVSRQRPFDISAMNRATVEHLGDSHSLAIHVATAEDAIISKLEWYRKTNETSERQWDDVIRLLKLLGEAADVQYLKKSAVSVSVEDLLERLMSEA